jgi:hypothetical protein
MWQTLGLYIWISDVRQPTQAQLIASRLWGVRCSAKPRCSSITDVHQHVPQAQCSRDAEIVIVVQPRYRNSNLQFKSSRKTLYFSRSACSSSTTSNRLPVKLFAWTTTDHKKATVKESNHLIVWLMRSWTCSSLCRVELFYAMRYVCFCQACRSRKIAARRLECGEGELLQPHDIHFTIRTAIATRD